MVAHNYIAIRHAIDATHEWMDTETLSGLREEAQRKATERDAALPQWAAANPVQRIARVVVMLEEDAA